MTVEWCKMAGKQQVDILTEGNDMKVTENVLHAKQDDGLRDDSKLCIPILPEPPHKVFPTVCTFCCIHRTVQLNIDWQE